MSDNMGRRRGPGGPRMMAGEKARDFKGSMAKLIRYMSKYKIRFVVMFVFAIAGTVFNIVGPKILGKATTELFNGLVAKIGGTGGIDFTKIAQILLFTLGLYVCSSIFSFIQGFIMTGISNDVTYSLRKDISKKINRLPLKYYESRTTGEILSRVTNDVDTLQNGLNQSVTQLITSVTTLIGVFIMMLSINVWMTLAALVILPVSMGIIGGVMGKSQGFFRNQQKYLGEVNGQIEEVYGGHNVVKVFNKEKDVVEEFEKVNKELYNSAWKSQFFSGIMMPIMQFIGNLGYVVVAILGGFMVIKNAIEVGDIQSFFQYIRNFTQPIQQIAQVTNMLQSAAAASERVFEFLEENEEDQKAEHPVSTDGLKGNVEFRHVQFGYDPEQVIIHDFSAKVKDGQKIAIVGPTGAGKTTIVNLISRFYDATRGQVLIDGYNLQDVTLKSLRSQMGVMTQDTFLFTGTIRENICYGREGATEAEMIAAAKAVNAHDFIMKLENGYDTKISERGGQLSIGQRQLLAFARTIVSDPRILILDEATSSIDTHTERIVQHGIAEMIKGRTSFIIAHRLSTIRNADRIFYIGDGKILEQGNHEELMEKCGLYYRLYESQFERR